MKISNEVLAVLSSLEVAGNTIKMAKLERSLYLKVDQVLQAMGGKWTRKLQAHTFIGDPVPLVEQVLMLGEITTHKDLGFFSTPSALAIELVERADVKPRDVVLEPSAGEGAIVKALTDLGAHVYAIERDPKRRERIGRGSNIIVQVDQTCDDFLDYICDDPFDRVVMNPPFCRVGKGDHLDHVRHAFNMLVPHGVLVSVLPAGVLFRQDKRHREFRGWALDGSANSFRELPDDSFKESGTGVRTCVLRMMHP